MGLKIALIQQHASRDREDNLERGRKSFLEAARAGAGLAAFAELGLTWFHPQHPAGPDFRGLAETVPGPTTDLFCRLACETGTAVVLNLFERAGRLTYDSSPVIGSDGSILGVTRMAHIMDGPGFRERGYYVPADNGPQVFRTSAGMIGVAICYDRHFPEYMRGLKLLGAELVVIPQAGSIGEWPEGLYEAEVRTAAFQNGYFAVLVNRVGKEDVLEFAGESFAADPDGRIIARAPAGSDTVLYADCDLSTIPASHAARHFLPDRRPDLYRGLTGS